jgi:hypothetical protein
MAGIHLATQEKLYAFAIFNQFIGISPPVGGGGAATPAVQLNSIFSAKTDPSENPEKNPGTG